MQKTDDRVDFMDADALMRQLKDGDLDRAGDLFSLYNKRLYNFFLKSTFDRDLSHDLTQNVFYRMIRYRKSFRGTDPFKSWIYQIARNTMAEHYRKEKRKSRFADLEEIAEKAEQPDMGGDQYINLYRAMTCLDNDQREILVLSRYQDLKYKEIAEILDMTETNVKTKVHRALKQLREELKKMEV